MIPNDPRSTDALTNYLHAHDPDYVPPKVTVTVSHAFDESDLIEVGRLTLVIHKTGQPGRCSIDMADVRRAVAQFLRERKAHSCDNCGGEVPRDSRGTPLYPTSHGSSVGLCQECAREAISL